MNCKKIILSISIILILISLSFGVYAINKNTFKLKSLNEVAIDTDIKVKDTKNNKQIWVGGKEENIKYVGQRLEKDVYENKDSEEFIFNNDKLVGFLKKSNWDITKNYSLNEKDANKIAENFLKNNIEDANNYKLLFSNYLEAYGEFYFVYMYKLNNYNTEDAIRININKNGEIVAFSAFYQGRFEKYKDVKINMEEMKQDVINVIKEKYGDNINRYEMNDPYFRIIDEKLNLQFDIDVILNNIVETTTTSAEIESSSTEIIKTENFIFEIK